MAFGWRVLIPVSLIWIVLVAGFRAFRLDNTGVSEDFLAIGSVALGALLIVMLVAAYLGGRKEPPQDPQLPAGAMDIENEIFPVPPLPGMGEPVRLR